MRKVLVIALREYLAAVRSKAFLIGLGLMPLFIGGGIAAQILLKDQVDLKPKQFVIVDRTPGQQVIRELEDAAKKRNEQVVGTDGTAQTGPAFLLEAAPPTAESDLPQLRYGLSERVRDGELTGFLEIGPAALQPLTGQVAPLARVHGKSAAVFGEALPPGAEAHALRYQTNRPGYQDFSQWAAAMVSESARKRWAAKHHVTVSELDAVVQPVPLVSKGLTTRDPATGEIREAETQNPIVAVLLPGGLIVLMFMLILLGAAPLLQGVMEEKMQRIAEVLLGSVQPFALMMGKIFGMVGVSLTMGAVYLAGAYWTVHHYGYAEYLSVEIIAWFLLYQVLAVFMFGSLYAAVGAACTDMKEAQAMLMPVTLVAMVPLFVWVNVVREPTSAFSTGISLFPPAIPTLMLARQAVPPGVPQWQPLLGVAIMVATTLLCVYAAGRVFRVGILLQGKGARLSDLVRWVIRG